MNRDLIRQCDRSGCRWWRLVTNRSGRWRHSCWCWLSEYWVRRRTLPINMPVSRWLITHLCLHVAFYDIRCRIIFNLVVPQSFVLQEDMASRRPRPTLSRSESTRSRNGYPAPPESRDERLGEVPFEDEVEEQLLSVGLESMEATVRGLILDLEQDEVVVAQPRPAESGPSYSHTPSRVPGTLSDIYSTL
jgi:hypothetical protein